jgi:hypothetical protein
VTRGPKPLPLAASACSARPHDVVAARELLPSASPELPRLAAIVGDRAYCDLERLAARKGLSLDIKAKPPGTTFVPLRPLVKVEHAFAQLGRWRRLSLCYEGVGGQRPRLARGGLGRLSRPARLDLTDSRPSRRGALGRVVIRSLPAATPRCPAVPMPTCQRPSRPDRATMNAVGQMK